jgi:hypothetical protein
MLFSYYQPFHSNNNNDSGSPESIRLNMLSTENKLNIILNRLWFNHDPTQHIVCAEIMLWTCEHATSVQKPQKPIVHREARFQAVDIKPCPTSFSGEVDTCKGSRPREKSTFSRPDQKLLPAPSDFEKTNALAFLEATYPQSNIYPEPDALDYVETWTTLC